MDDSRRRNRRERKSRWGNEDDVQNENDSQRQNTSHVEVESAATTSNQNSVQFERQDENVENDDIGHQMQNMEAAAPNYERQTFNDENDEEDFIVNENDEIENVNCWNYYFFFKFIDLIVIF